MSLYLLTDALQSWLTDYEPVFRGHLLKPLHQEALFNNAQQSYWPTLILFFMLALLVILRVTAPVKTLRVLTAAYSLQVAKQIEREDYSPFKRVSVILSVVFVLSLGFLFLKTNQLYGSVLQGKTTFFQYSFFVMVIVLVYTMKLISINLMSFLTGARSLFKEYILNTLIINQSVGFVLFPVMVICELSDINTALIVMPCLLLLGVSWILRLYRGFTFAIGEEGVGILQLFVYLCALEILPLLVMIKFLIVNF